MGNSKGANDVGQGALKADPAPCAGRRARTEDNHGVLPVLKPGCFAQWAKWLPLLTNAGAAQKQNAVRCARVQYHLLKLRYALLKCRHLLHVSFLKCRIFFLERRQFFRVVLHGYGWWVVYAHGMVPPNDQSSATRREEKP